MTTEPEIASPEAAQKTALTFGRHKCLFCGEVFTAKHNRQLKFCKPEHKTAFQDQQRIRGRQMVKLAQCWRLGRNTRNPDKKALASWALQEVCALGDLYNAEDAKAGVPDAFESVRRMKEDFYRPSVDGKRSLDAARPR